MSLSGEEAALAVESGFTLVRLLAQLALHSVLVVYTLFRDTPLFRIPSVYMYCVVGVPYLTWRVQGAGQAARL